MSVSFNMNTWTEIAINTNLFESSAGVTSADYVLSISMTSAELFTSAHYKQNANSATEYDVDFELNADNLLTYLASSTVGLDKENAVNANMSNFTTSGSAGALLLQVMATKIFGHPKAVAAIANDDVYINDLPGRISSGIHDIFNVLLEGQESNDNNNDFDTVVTDIKNIFEYYVGLGRITSSDDISEWQPMVFQSGDKFTFPFHLNGGLLDDDDSNGSGTPALLNGSSVFADVDAVISANGDLVITDKTPNTPYIGKDGGQGYILSIVDNSNGSGLLNVGYTIPIRLEITIASS